MNRCEKMHYLTCIGVRASVSRLHTCRSGTSARKMSIYALFLRNNKQTNRWTGGFYLGSGKRACICPQDPLEMD